MPTKNDWMTTSNVDSFAVIIVFIVTINTEICSILKYEDFLN